MMIMLHDKNDGEMKEKAVKAERHYEKTKCCMHIWEYWARKKNANTKTQKIKTNTKHNEISQQQKKKNCYLTGRRSWYVSFIIQEVVVGQHLIGHCGVAIVVWAEILCLYMPRCGCSYRSIGIVIYIWTTAVRYGWCGHSGLFRMTAAADGWCSDWQWWWFYIWFCGGGGGGLQTKMKIFGQNHMSANEFILWSKTNELNIGRHFDGHCV